MGVRILSLVSPVSPLGSREILDGEILVAGNEHPVFGPAPCLCLFFHRLDIGSGFAGYPGMRQGWNNLKAGEPSNGVQLYVLATRRRSRFAAPRGQPWSGAPGRCGRAPDSRIGSSRVDAQRNALTVSAKIDGREYATTLRMEVKQEKHARTALESDAQDNSFPPV